MELYYYKLLALFKKEKRPYVLAGGNKGIKNLVEDFYEIMDKDSKVDQIRQMHPKDLTLSKEKLTKFLSGWFGGPNLYWQAYGHPRMRARHMKFTIDASARDQWLACMKMAIQNTKWNQEFKDYTYKSMSDFAHHMQNRK